MDCTLPGIMLLQHAAGGRHLPSCNSAHVACTWRSKVGVGSLASSFPPLEPGYRGGTPANREQSQTPVAESPYQARKLQDQDLSKK